MKIYSKIVGIILTITGIGAFIGVIAGIIGIDNFEEKIGLSLLFIPCIIFLHYMYIHNFGFNLKSEIPQKNYRTILILTLLSLILTITVPVGYLLRQINLSNSAEKLIDRGKDESPSSGLTSNLKTKYEDGRMLYILDIVTPNKSELSSNYETFLIELKDKDGFNITTIEIDNFTNLVDGKIRYGITSNSSKLISLTDYLKIADWDLLYITKN
jgi:hypothetical protein